MFSHLIYPSLYVNGMSLYRGCTDFNYSLNGPTDSDGSDNVLQVSGDPSSDTNPITHPTSPHGNQ